MRRLAVTVFTAFCLLAGVGTARAAMDVIVNKSTQQMSVVIDGSVRYIWNISTGRDAYSTPNGTFVPEHLERLWFSRRYSNSPLPYAIFFHNGYAIHGSDHLGGPASQCCVRLHPEHAAILYDLVQRVGPENTRIVITGATLPRFAPAPPPNLGPKPYRDLNGLIESLQEPCNPKTPTGPGNQPNPACVPDRPTGAVADSRPNQAPAPAPPPASPPTPPPDPPADQAQPHAGYRLLPKSYWSGAAWRWRLGLE
jgi:hypothetical protein